MYYFVSDVHLRGGEAADVNSCESRFINWLDSIAPTAREIYLMGDIFDFWYEWRRVVPKGFVRVLAKFAQLTQQGVRIVFIAGNHDMWVRDYFTKECGVEIYTKAQIVEIGGKRLYVAHGDNLNIGSNIWLRLMNKTFRSSIARVLFSWLVHPDLALKFGSWWSNSSRKKHRPYKEGEHIGSEILLSYVEQEDANLHCDYYLFGHMHTVVDKEVKGKRVMMINDWGQNPHYIEINQSAEAQIKEV
ncbi:MAG: UDP-2,3-diacylglucosamine diphosphatase [Rikenellaceae bacterium]